MFDSNRVFPDTHIGRAELRLSHLEGMPDKFTCWFELWNKRLTVSNTSDSKGRTLLSENIGAIQLELLYVKQSVEAVCKDPMKFIKESEAQVTEKIEKEVSEVSTQELEDRIAESTPTGEIVDKVQSMDEEARLRRIDSYNSEMPEEVFQEEDSQITSFFFKLYGFIIPDTAMPVMRTVHRIMMAFGQGLEISSSNMAIGILLIELYYRQTPM